MAKFVIRIRTKVGTWRMNDVEGKNKVSEIIARVEHDHNIKVGKVSLKQNYSEILSGDERLDKIGAKNGTMFFMEISGGTVVVGNTRRHLDEKGNVVIKGGDNKGIRPGLHALRDKKLHWTLTDMTELEDKYTYKITSDQTERCAKASLDVSACQSFQQYIGQMNYNTCRCGILYGKFVDSEAEAERKKEEEEAKTRRAANIGYGSTKKNMNLSDLEKKTKKGKGGETGCNC
mmetsp:Transcript_32264/g.39687  ORF Transcript_32264/g.39687 Transcript_32264/m.39687 type:complete len:232 (+) Transcript_32264:334-1029(+)